MPEGAACLQPVPAQSDTPVLNSANQLPLHWWTIPVAAARPRIEQLARTIGLSGNAFKKDCDVLGRIVASLVSTPNTWLSFSRKPAWYSRYFGQLPEFVNQRSVPRVVDAMLAASPPLVRQQPGSRKDKKQSMLWAEPALLELLRPSETIADRNAPPVVVKEKGPRNNELFRDHCRRVKKLRLWMRTFTIEAPVRIPRMSVHESA